MIVKAKGLDINSVTEVLAIKDVKAGSDEAKIVSLLCEQDIIQLRPDGTILPDNTLSYGSGSP